MPKTLLLVEDSFTIQHVVQTTFGPADFRVVVAHNAREGLTKLQEQTPDVVLADATMPDMDGFQLCQHIRETAGCERLPVLLLTSRFAVYDDAHGQRVGVTGHVAKPFEPHILLAAVQRCLASAVTPPHPLSMETVSAVPETTTTTPVAESIAVHEALGKWVLQTIQEALHTQVTGMLETLIPAILAEVRQTVSAKVPELLEILLQQEIEKLKRAVAEESDSGAAAETEEA